MVSSVAALSSLALDRFKYSHMYTTMGLLGVLIAARGTSLPVANLVCVVSITIATTGLYILNDVFDLEIDRVVHPERALPRGLLSVRQAALAAIVLMVIGPAVSFYVDLRSGVLVATVAVLGVLYSAPPVRLRRFPVIPSVIIGLFVLLSFLAGAMFSHRPLTGKLVFGALLLWALFLCCSMAKDLGQEEGDAVDGVRTLPLILGSDRAFILTSAIVCSSFVFAILFILLFDLHWILVGVTIMLMFLEAFSLRRFWRARRTMDAPKWYQRSFMVFVVLQLCLVGGALRTFL